MKPKKKPKGKIEKWYIDYDILCFKDNKNNIVTKEEWEKFKGKYLEPTDKVLDAILELKEFFKRERGY